MSAGWQNMPGAWPEPDQDPSDAGTMSRVLDVPEFPERFIPYATQAQGPPRDATIPRTPYASLGPCPAQRPFEQVYSREPLPEVVPTPQEAQAPAEPQYWFPPVFNEVDFMRMYASAAANEPHGAESVEDARRSLPRKLVKSQRVVAVMGATGTGKSTFINHISKKAAVVGHSLESCTTEIEEFPCVIKGKPVILLDTPGFNDTNRSDSDILRSLAEWMRDAAEEGMFFSGIIYLHSISDVRMTGSSMANIRMFRALCGDENFSKLVLATTKWENTKKEDAETRHTVLSSPDGYWSPFIAGGSKVRRLKNTKKSANALLEEVLGLNRHTFAPRIQQEMMEGKPIRDTEAGVLLQGNILEVRNRAERDMQELREAYEEAMNSQNHIMMRELEKQKLLMDKKIEKSKNEERRLNASEKELLQQRVKSLEEELRVRPNTRFSNYRKWWSTHWKCIGCRRKTRKAGQWTCPGCSVRHDNKLSGP